MPLTIRPAQLADAPSFVEILRATGWFGWIDKETPAESTARVQRQLAMCLANRDCHTVYAALDEQDRVIGYISAHWQSYLIHDGPEGYISEVFVHPQGRGQGAGTLLLDAVKDEAIRRGCYRLSLINFRGRESYWRGFYKKAGWEERDQAANFILRLKE